MIGVWLLPLLWLAAGGGVSASDAVLLVDFSKGPPPGWESPSGAAAGPRMTKDGGAEFTDALQVIQATAETTAEVSRRLDKIEAMSVGGWFFPRRRGEQCFFFRGLPQIAPLGERTFRPNPAYVNFCLGTDQHGFLMGAINGNGIIPFPLVTLNELAINDWYQAVLVKDAEGYQHFYLNGSEVHNDRNSCWSGRIWPFKETGQAALEPVRLAMPQGGLVGEAWVFSRALGADEIRQDYLAKRQRYRPAPAAEPVGVREMDAHPTAHLWTERPTEANWPAERERIRQKALKLLGPFPKRVAPEPQVHGEEDCGSYVRRKVSIAVEAGDRMPFYLLIPKRREGRLPAVICFYGTTSGAGKETTVGLSGPEPNTPPRKNRGFAVDVVEAGMVALAADYLRDGERVHASDKPYDATRFYRDFPGRSIVGKDAWDNMRAVDYLQGLDFVDPQKIGMMGHSYGGHSTIFAAALEPRIRCAVANGPVSEFREYGQHWAVPRREYILALRPYVLDPERPLPLTFYEFTALIAPRPLWVGQAVGERRPREEENHAAVDQVYQALKATDACQYLWYPGDHDFPPQARKSAIEWLKRWLGGGGRD